MIPSTRSKRNDTPFVEFWMKSKKDGHTAGVQVKSGKTKINYDEYPKKKEKIYLFSPAGYIGDNNNGSTTIKKKEIIEFIFNNRRILPDYMKSWIKLIYGK